PAGGRGGRGDAGPLVVRRAWRSEKDRHAGRGLGPPGRAARLHRPGVLTASVHLSLNFPNKLVQGIGRGFTTGWYREVLTEPPEIRDGFVYPMTGPGLGTKLQPERLTGADCERRVSKA